MMWHLCIQKIPTLKFLPGKTSISYILKNNILPDFQTETEECKRNRFTYLQAKSEGTWKLFRFNIKASAISCKNKFFVYGMFNEQ